MSVGGCAPERLFSWYWFVLLQATTDDHHNTRGLLQVYPDVPPMPRGPPKPEPPQTDDQPSDEFAQSKSALHSTMSRRMLRTIRTKIHTMKLYCQQSYDFLHQYPVVDWSETFLAEMDSLLNPGTTGTAGTDNIQPLIKVILNQHLIYLQ